MFVFFFSDSRIVSHSTFTCNWQTRFWDSEPIVTRFLSNTCEASDIRIPRNFMELYPHVCVFFAMYVGWARAVCRNKMFYLLFF